MGAFQEGAQTTNTTLPFNALGRFCDADGMLVRVEGLEPPRLAAPEPKSGASTNFATPASAEALSKLGTACEGKIRVAAIQHILPPIRAMCEKYSVIPAGWGSLTA